MLSKQTYLKLSLSWLAVPAILLSSQVASAACAPGAIDLSELSFRDYADQNIDNNYQVVNDGCSMYIAKNSWIASNQTFTIKENTVLEFGYIGSTPGEIHGLGFDQSVDSAVNGNRIFKVDWTFPQFGIYPGKKYSGGSAYEVFTIEIGKYFTGEGFHLVFMMDQDVETGASGYYTNIRLVNKGEPPVLTTPRPVVTPTPAVTPTPVVTPIITPEPDVTPTPEPIVTPGPIVTPNPDFTFDHLDWESNSLTQHHVGPPPRSNPPEALLTPINGAQPTSHGFAFDISGDTASWRWGPNIVKQGGDSGLEIHCSEDNNETFKKAAFNGGQASIPCSGDYTYFFRYLHPHSLNNSPAHQWIWTGLFTTEGGRVDPFNYEPFTDSSANWMRYRHPITNDGITAAVLDRPNAGERLRNLDRYLTWVEDSPGNVNFEFEVEYLDPELYQGDNHPTFRRNEALRNASAGPNGQQFFAVNTGGATNGDGVPKDELEGFGNYFSYGQVISYEVSVEAAGTTSAQTYNDFSHYIVGCGFCGKYGDPRLNSAGKASTSQVFSDKGDFSYLEYNAIFTQPMVTLHKEDMVDDFLLGHHLFHGIDPNKRSYSFPRVNRADMEFPITNPTGTKLPETVYDPFDDPDARIGERSCGGCHFRDGRGSEVVDTPNGPRLVPPIYGVKLLEAIAGREAGFGWQGQVDTVEQQVRDALVNDHKVDPDALPGRVLELITAYTEVITVPARDPGTYDMPGVAEGDVLFNQVGCDSCHTPVQRTRSDAETHLRDIVLRPYTDMKTWDLGDGPFRTTPLWGLGQNINLLERNSKELLFWHDGSATSVDEAIQKHGGAGASVRDSYNALDSSEKQNIANFVRSL